MTKDVLLTISGLQFDALNAEEESNEPIKVVTPATYYQEDGNHYVVYDEVEEGASGVTKNKIKIAPRVLEVTKTGSVNATMIFEEKRKTTTIYETPYGRFMLGITSGRINFTENEEEIHVGLDYILDVNYQPLLSCELDLDIVPKSKGELVF
mgnify:CR=1 FL=1